MCSRRQGVVGQVAAQVEAPAVLPEQPAPVAKAEQAPEFSRRLLEFSLCLAHRPMGLMPAGFNSRRLVLPEQILSDLELLTAWALGSAAQMAWGLAQPTVWDSVRPMDSALD